MLQICFRSEGDDCPMLVWRTARTVDAVMRPTRWLNHCKHADCFLVDISRNRASLLLICSPSNFLAFCGQFTLSQISMFLIIEAAEDGWKVVSGAGIFTKVSEMKDFVLFLVSFTYLRT